MTTPTPSLRAFDELAANRRTQRGTPVPQLALDQIGPLPGQPRQSFDPEALAELSESIKTHGVIQPIIVIARKDVSETDPVRYRIVCGERRYQAARMAGMNAIPALVRDYEDDEVAVLALLENLQREDLTPLEEGEYLLQLKQKYGFTEEQLGERLGKTRDYVHMRTRLLNLSPDILAVWKEPTEPGVFGKLTPSHAILINQVEDAGVRQAMVASILEHGATVAEVRRRLNLLKQLEDAPSAMPEKTAEKLKLRVATGMGDAELAMWLGRYVEKPVAEPLGEGPRMALDDLEVYKLMAKLVEAGDREVAFREFEAALKKDMAWVRKINRDGLANG